MKITTLLFPMSEDGSRVVLAMKKRGFGSGKYNGVGGKIEQGESIVAAATREAEEEIGIQVMERAVHARGDIRFTFENRPEWDTHVHVFVTYTWSGDPQESEEMAPQWFRIDELPLDRMWVSDVAWVPQVLAGSSVEGSVHFDAAGSKVLDTELRFQAEK